MGWSCHQGTCMFSLWCDRAPESMPRLLKLMCKSKTANKFKPFFFLIHYENTLFCFEVCKAMNLPLAQCRTSEQNGT